MRRSEVDVGAVDEDAHGRGGRRYCPGRRAACE
jgi:hypothetical protein